MQIQKCINLKTFFVKCFSEMILPSLVNNCKALSDLLCFWCNSCRSMVPAWRKKLFTGLWSGRPNYVPFTRPAVLSKFSPLQLFITHQVITHQNIKHIFYRNFLKTKINIILVLRC